MSIRQVENRLVGVDRVLATLRELAHHPNGVALEELAQRLGQPKSSIHRALAALRRCALVQQDEDRRYRLSLEFVGLAFRYYESLEEQVLVNPTLEALATRLSETAHYAVLDGADVIYVAKVTPPDVGFKMAGTLTTAAALARELAATRERGYALDDQENEPGVNCIAFAVFTGPRERPAGAISVSAVAQRTPVARLAEQAEEIRALIEERLGPVTRAHR